jgi:hypothetical protein
MLDEAGHACQQPGEAEAEHDAHYHSDVLEDFDRGRIGAHSFKGALSLDRWQTCWPVSGAASLPLIHRPRLSGRGRNCPIRTEGAHDAAGEDLRC